MEFKMNIEMDNDAFTGDPAREVARILRNVAERFSGGEYAGTVRDANGNRVGSFEITT